MKRIHLFSLTLGLALGFAAAAGVLKLPHACAEEPKPVMTQEELDKKLDAILEDQKQVAKRLEDVVTQTQFLKAASGK